MAGFRRTKTERGIARIPNGWTAAEVTHGTDPDGSNARILCRKVIGEGPYKGTGAKARAIRDAGTNRVVTA